MPESFTFDVAESAHRMDRERKKAAPPTPINPHYCKVKQTDPSATQMWMIRVDEGWRDWILATEMYEWAADAMLEILWDSNARWPH